MRRTAILLMAFLALGAQPAFAASPNGGCGSGFSLETVENLAPLGIPAFVLDAVDTNDNGLICFQESNTHMSSSSPNFGHHNLVDDRGPAR